MFPLTVEKRTTKDLSLLSGSSETILAEKTSSGDSSIQNSLTYNWNVIVAMPWVDSNLILLICCWFGYECVTVMSSGSWNWIQCIAGGIPIGITIITWTFFLLQSIMGEIPQYLGICTFFIFALFSAFIHFSRILFHVSKGKHIHKMPIPRTTMINVFVSVCFTTIFLYFSELYKGVLSAGTVQSDLPVHLSIITSCAYGYNSNKRVLQTPFFAGTDLCYPIVPDYFSAILVKYGNASLRTSICLPSVLLLFSLFVSFEFVAYHFSPQKYLAFLSVVLFMFSSGTGWIRLFDLAVKNNVNINLSHQLTPQRDTFWMHPILHYLLPQRSALFSYPLALMTMMLLIRIYYQYPRTDYASMAFAGFCMGSLPLISAHTYIAVGQFALSLCCFSFPWRHPKKWLYSIKYWGTFGLTAIVISGPQLLWLMRENRIGFMTLQPIWKETKDNFFSMWWGSLGVFFWLSIVHVWLVLDKKQTQLYLATMPSFIISHFWLYQPGAMDNNKVFYISWYPFACMAVAKLLLNYPILMFPFIPACTISSCVCCTKFLASIGHLFDWDSFQLGMWSMKFTSPDDIIINAGVHENPLMALGGRLTTMGYPGWVWTHGLSIRKRLDEINAAYQEPDYRKLVKSHWRYVFLTNGDYYKGPAEFFDVSIRAYDHWMQLIRTPQNHSIFRVIKPIVWENKG